MAEAAPTVARKNDPALNGRLYVKAVFSGFTRGQRNQNETSSILKLDNVYNKNDAQWYVGKRVVYVYKAHNKKNVAGAAPSRVRCIWGRVTRSHGNTGAVRAKFHKNLPATALGQRIRVMLYPSNI
ncbi:rpl-33 [Pristionchus pacificus]|uniref:Large ribosomal subunit protein eL33 n=1 Tax=Pristionchus pacificus TaxID=54126 RepID=A0A2A6B7R3_PRIPA|nr:rpl-33 [Pristionchus pacificus]|eukprot:PDM61903.1 rpl-33 [Pristionchus pacificus]